MRVVTATALVGLTAWAGCPFSGKGGNRPHGHPSVGLLETNFDERFPQAVQNLDFAAVKRDVKRLLEDSQEFWPADYGNYAGLFIRLSWHSAGSYRISDGRGGGDGGRMRFDPERSWDDNTNLDKARRILWPIKQKYGLGLSWADLMILAGTVAIEDRGGVTLGFCWGRTDDESGEDSILLGPSKEQEVLFPCDSENNGFCVAPFGAVALETIYVNPSGPGGSHDPAASAESIRDVFGRMGMNDSETVALIGGGHTLGKTHGACPLGAGPAPDEDPNDPWPGNCGTGIGNDSFTTGFEGPWTSNPIDWDNQYFKNLISFNWTLGDSPGGNMQWFAEDADPAPAAFGDGEQPIMMLTSDIALINDESYLAIVNEFADDLDAFNAAFAAAWYKLTTRDSGPAERCLGPDVPPPQPFQNPLPPPPRNPAPEPLVRRALTGLNDTSSYIRLAWRCASTFRRTDYAGGCNGARIRFSPEIEWEVNAGLDSVISSLEPIKNTFGDRLSWADLIVLAGNVAIEQSGGRPMQFCPGRSDATDGSGSEILEPRITGTTNDTIELLGDFVNVLGLTKRQYVAIVGGAYSGGAPLWSTETTDGSSTIDNTFFTNLIENEWTLTTDANGVELYKAEGEELYLLQADLIVRWDPEMLMAAQEFASDNATFRKEFASAWTQVMNADRFDGPFNNVCLSE